MGESAYRKLEGRRVAIAGAGNVAWHLARALRDSGWDIVQVCSRTIASASVLAAEVGAAASGDFSSADPTADFCIVCVTDSAVAQVAQALPHMRGVVVHTSGTVPMDVLKICAERVGVLYPLQTFSRDRALNIKEVPFFTEASDASTLVKIDGMAASIGAQALHADSDARSLLHVAGVLACNFPNYLIGCAQKILSRGGYGLDVLRPLVAETIAKSFQMGPEAAQTGPARRGNTETIKKHIALLPDDQAEIYSLISDAILKKYHSDE
ncbi:MAG: DUF2520 domain-containing protein [Muribaculaceae bacterium]|nr:DUF2520 domain-containing protein [Muribaculaceae bacterium]